MITAFKALIGQFNGEAKQSDREKAFVAVAPKSIRNDFDMLLIEQLPHVAARQKRTFLLCGYMLPPEYNSDVRMVRRSLMLNSLKNYLVRELWTYGTIATDDYREIVCEAGRAGALICNNAELGSTAYRYAEMYISWQKTVRRLCA